ncbi:MAG: dihydrofolate reductase, partial [Paludibacteraceae bacterium]|nr:dihydrofolate reductase [Paludibacteraceae bacterium]
MLSIIVAISENYAIGKNNDLLCRISADLKRFKALTTGHTVIMGRNTYLSLPNGALPNRRNIVVSRTMHDADDHIEIASSHEEAIQMCNDEDEVFVIGGAQIYKCAIGMADRLYIPWIH